jgi:hypothetical protein
MRSRETEVGHNATSRIFCCSRITLAGHKHDDIFVDTSKYQQLERSITAVIVIESTAPPRLNWLGVEYVFAKGEGTVARQVSKGHVVEPLDLLRLPV